MSQQIGEFMSKAVTYASYLRIDELLNLQTPQSGEGQHAEHDETLFIIIHQVYELWFKQLLHEIDYVAVNLRKNDTARVTHTIRRILTILKTVVAQIDVLETMTPLEFNSFRGFLDTASGFQSAQFRELEFALGYKRAAMLAHHPEGSAGRARLEARYQAPTLWDAFLNYLTVNGYTVPSELLSRDQTQPLEPSAAIQTILIQIYRENPTISGVCELLLDMDEGLQEWRYRHVKMVSRTIGSKPGTGGSSGVAYLSTTIQPLFPDLWAIRAQL
jgi:tryptophan 2,3-dioxygenase